MEIIDLPEVSAVAFTEATDRLLRANTALHDLILAQKPPLIIHTHECDNPWYLAARHMTRIWYSDNQRLAEYPGFVLGVIEGNDQLLAAAEDLNACKLAFRALLKPFGRKVREQVRSRSRMAIANARNRNPDLQLLMGQRQVKDLNLTQCYRLIHMLEPGVDRIGFTWQRNQIDAVELSRSEVEARVNAYGDELRSIYMADLARLHGDVRFYLLASRKETPDVPRLNQHFGERGNRQCKTILPSSIVMSRGPMPERQTFKRLEEAQTYARRPAALPHAIQLGNSNIYYLP